MRAATSWRLAPPVLVCLAILLGSGQLAVPATATVVAAVDATAIDDHVHAMLDGWAVPGGAIAIARDGAIVHLAAFGEASPGRPMTSGTPVAIGSVGKSITALAVRQLVEAGRLGLDWPVTRALPWFRLAGPAGTADRITIGDLVRHTSGLSTADGQDPRRYAADLTPEAVVRGLEEVAPAGPPGAYAYSNLNFVVLGVVIEAVSGEPYRAYVQRHIFEPLGMSRSFTDPAGAPAAEDTATGHRYLFGVPVAFDEPYPSAIVAAGYQSS